LTSIKYDFIGSKALITGATRGLGRAVAEALLKAGCHVTITGSSEKTGWWTSKLNCNYIPVDFYDKNQTEEFLKLLTGEMFNLVVNNVGVFDNTPIDQLKLEDWDRVLHINLTLSLQIIQATSLNMKILNNCRIVNIASIAAFVNRTSTSAYGVSKAGIVALTRTAALDLSIYGVLVNCICPGYIETDMMKLLNDEKRQSLISKVPLGRFCQPEEITSSVLFLLSEENTFITGQTLIIDGGVTIQQ
jgi:NAD(P)-dependent dehydrogenase (short-subunit alcohol dehydrogenase family)